MSDEWPSTRFGEFLRENRRPYLLGPEEDANLVGMRLYGGGPFHRELKPALKIAKKSHFVINEGDVIYNKLFAWKGTFGIVPKALDGMLVSDKFPTYALDRDRVDERFLAWYFRNPNLWEQARALSTGSAALSKLTLNPPKFLLLTLPLPPLAEQRHLVARIEQLAAAIRDARALREESAAAVDGLVTTAVADQVEGDWPTTLLRPILREPPRNGLSPKPEADSGGRLMLRINAVSSTSSRFVDLAAGKRVKVSEAEAEPFVLQNDDVFVVRYNADVDRVAKAAIFKSDRSRIKDAVFPDKLIRLRPDPSRMLPDFLVLALNSRRVRAQVRGMGKTTAGNVGISGSNVTSLVVSLPPVSEQRRIVAELDVLQERVDSLRHLQDETAAAIEALLPALLDRAFRGELLRSSAALHERASGGDGRVDEASPRVLSLLKFGPRAYIEDFRKGQLFMKPVEYFRQLERDHLRGDASEGTTWSFSSADAQLQVEVAGRFQTIPGIVGPIRFSKDADRRANVFCMHALRGEPSTPLVDPRNFAFGDTFALLLDSDEFLRRVRGAAIPSGQRLHYALVRYVDHAEHNRRMGVFHKFRQFRYQSEFRIALLPGTGGDHWFQVGDLADLVVTGPLNSINERIRLA